MTFPQPTDDRPATKADLEEMKIELIRGITVWTVGSMAIAAALVFTFMKFLG